MTDKVKNELIDLLRELENYMEDKADAEGLVPNEEMKFLARIAEVRAKTESENVVAMLYGLLVKEFSALQNTSYPKHKLNGYEDALWDFKIIAKDDFATELQTVKQNTTIADKVEFF